MLLGYLDQKHFSGANYTEVDVDIGSSRIARGVVGIILPQAKKLIIDEAFLIEGQVWCRQAPPPWHLLTSPQSSLPAIAS